MSENPGIETPETLFPGLPGSARPEATALAESVAAQFHARYERLAPEHGYQTREASAVPWPDVPPANRGLMTAVVLSLLDDGVITVPGADVTRLRQALWDCYRASGSDPDGDVQAPAPGVLSPDVPELALQAVRELRQDYREALREAR